MTDAVKIGYKVCDTDFVVFNGIYASIKQHIHYIISDRFFQDEKVDITKEPRVEVFR